MIAALLIANLIAFLWFLARLGSVRGNQLRLEWRILGAEAVARDAQTRVEILEAEKR